MLVNVGIVHADIKPENILLKHRVRPLSLCRCCAFAISVTLLICTMQKLVRVAPLPFAA